MVSYLQEEEKKEWKKIRYKSQIYAQLIWFHIYKKKKRKKN